MRAVRTVLDVLGANTSGFYTRIYMSGKHAQSVARLHERLNMSTNLDLTESRTAASGLLILSHTRARNFRPSKFGVENSCSMIRVEDPHTSFKSLIFHEEFCNTSEFQFDDATVEWNPAYGHMHLITQGDADGIVNFFEHAKDHRLLVVHCFAGICRSSAIAAAYAKFIQDQQTHDLIWECKKYVPNSYVYSMLIDTLRKRGYHVDGSVPSEMERIETEAGDHNTAKQANSDE